MKSAPKDPWVVEWEYERAGLDNRPAAAMMWAAIGYLLGNDIAGMACGAGMPRFSQNNGI